MKKLLIILIGILVIPGFLATAHATPINLAPNGTATQSSLHGFADASRANDGNTDGDFWQDSVTHTNFERGWWQVDLGSEFELDSIMLWNRTDHRPHRLTDFRVSALDSELDEVWGQDYFSNGGTFDPSLFILLPDSTTAQTVKIQLYNINWLSLAEVQVFGYDIQESAMKSPDIEHTPKVPEPGIMLLLASGLTVSFAFRKKLVK